jgi:hypothetical protein
VREEADEKNVLESIREYVKGRQEKQHGEKLHQFPLHTG